MKYIHLGKPIINYTAYYDAMWMLLDKNDESCAADIFENFTNILYRFTDRTGVHFSEFQNNNVFKTLDIKNVPRNSVSNKIEFFCSAIDDGYIILQCLDYYYIEKYKGYMVEHGIHDPMIYGYDMDSKEFLCGDYFDFTFFSCVKIPFSQIINACNSDYLNYDYMNGYILIRRKKTNIPFSIENLKRNMQNFVHNKGIGEYECGIQFFYKWIEDLKKNILEKNAQHERSFTFVYLFVKLMNYRISFLSSENYPVPNEIILKGNLFEDQFLKYRNIVLKCKIKSNLLNGYEKIFNDLQKTIREYVSFLKEVSIMIENF